MSAPTPNRSSLFSFPNADRTILITHKGELVLGNVSSAAMSMASPVRKKFITPPFGRLVPTLRSETPTSEISSEESVTAVHGRNDTNPTEEYNIQAPGKSPLEFQEDDSEALLILLKIAHVQFANIPTKLSYEKLLAVAVLVDLYDCVELIMPWVQSWIADEATESMKDGQESWLFIAWVFGREEVFVNLAGALSRKLDSKAEEKFLAGPMPPLNTENLLNTRLREIELILQVPYKIVDTIKGISAHWGSLHQTGSSTHSNSVPLRSRSGRIVPGQLCSHGQISCDVVSYGALLLGLASLNLWPEKNAKEVPVSVLTLASQLKDLQFPLWESGYYQYTNTHKACPLGKMAETIDGALTMKPTVATEQLLIHIRAQHKRLHPSA
ncbi:hypothetical protein HYFRA_00004659 [Hymenoscyphus fraxineus]|uniref:Uncharacterized protein n=1 Tax=Hymenoscyphus fraxineus TaxID=746836 RepID=A0A9N9KZ34_9HELO|nr:hypothetical protein HYFRA_00004659 [Hymenoscyphus fraxineus]